jgi:hypothetical protein
VEPVKGIRVLPWLFMLLLTACGTRNDAVRRTSEGGVEVVQNHIKPYRVKGVPSSLRLEEELAIDTEREDLVKRGVADIWGFDVNSLGDIFIFQPPMSTDRLISKFDKLGRFVTSFALKGQGPGEVQWPIFHKISSGDGVPVLDMVSRKLLLFNKDGIFLRETEVPFEIRGSAMLLQLPNGNYLHRKAEVTPSQENPSMVLIYRLINRDFQDIRELDRVQIPNPFGVPMVNLPLPLTAWAVAQDRIYMGNSEKGYELCVYDLDGNLIRKIRKEFASVPFPEEKKLAVLKTLESPSLAPLRDKLAFPTAGPSFQHLFCDDEGRLYVMTYEKGEKAGEFLFDVFNADSVFIAMTSCAAHLSADLYAPGSPTDSWVTAKNGRLYAVREKANGYKELVVYRMIWK